MQKNEKKNGKTLTVDFFTDLITDFNFLLLYIRAIFLSIFL